MSMIMSMRRGRGREVDPGARGEGRIIRGRTHRAREDVGGGEVGLVLGEEVLVREVRGGSRDGRRMGGGLRGGVERRVRGRLYEETHRLTGDNTIVLLFLFQTFCCSTVNVFFMSYSKYFFFSLSFYLLMMLLTATATVRELEKKGCWGQ
jgi:hypothetical protein